MHKSTILYQSDQQVTGRHLSSKEWVMFSGKLTIYDRKTNPIVLKLKSELHDTFIGKFMEDTKEFKGDSVSQVYGKLSKWYYKNGILLMD